MFRANDLIISLGHMTIGFHTFRSNDHRVSELYNFLSPHKILGSNCYEIDSFLEG